MKAKIKSIISQMAFLGITGTMLMVGSSSCKKDNQKQAPPPPPPSYNANDVQSMQNFFKQNSITNTKTNEQIFRDNNAKFDVNDPATWNIKVENTFIEFSQSRLANINLNNPSFGGDLDLTGCLGSSMIYLNGSNVASIKIPKKSLAGRTGWYCENAKTPQDVQSLEQGGTINESVLSKYGDPPQGDIVLTEIFDPNKPFCLAIAMHNTYAPRNIRKHPFINNSGISITVTLVD